MKYTFSIILAFDLFCNYSYGQTQPPPILLSIGEQRNLKIDGLLKYSLSGTAVKGLALPEHFIKNNKAADDHLLIKAIEPGLSSLLVWKRDGTIESRTIQVEKKPFSDIPHDVIYSLRNLTETDIFINGKIIRFEGFIHTNEEAKQLMQIESSYPQYIQNDVKLDEPLLQTHLHLLNTFLKKDFFKQRLSIDTQYGRLTIKGHLENLKSLKNLHQFIQRNTPLTIIQIEHLPDSSPTIFFQVFLVELSIGHFQDLGINWENNNSSALISSSIGLGKKPQLSDINIALQALEKNGHAKILSNPELAVRAPGEAELFSGGKIPLAAKGKYFSNVSWEKFGLLLKIKVTHATPSVVRLDISS
jgi:hypothetical protein